GGARYELPESLRDPEPGFATDLRRIEPTLLQRQKQELLGEPKLVESRPDALGELVLPGPIHGRSQPRRAPPATDILQDHLVEIGGHRQIGLSQAARQVHHGAFDRRLVFVPPDLLEVALVVLLELEPLVAQSAEILRSVLRRTQYFGLELANLVEVPELSELLDLASLDVGVHADCHG